MKVIHLLRGTLVMHSPFGRIVKRAEMSTATVKPATLREWVTKHRNHGRAGAWRDAKVGVYSRYRCPCGESFVYSDDEEAADPDRFKL